MRVLDLILRRKTKVDPQNDLDPIVRNAYHFAAELRLRSKEIEDRLDVLKETRRD